MVLSSTFQPGVCTKKGGKVLCSRGGWSWKQHTPKLNWNSTKLSLGRINLSFVLSPLRELVSRLHQRGVQVFLVSGGFQSIVEHVALQLNIPTANVFANRLKFYFNGESPLRSPLSAHSWTFSVCSCHTLGCRHCPVTNPAHKTSPQTSSGHTQCKKQSCSYFLIVSCAKGKTCHSC